MQTGYIYKIECNITGEVYYGSTEQDVETRIDNHVASLKCDKMKKKCTSSKIIERDNWCWEVMEEVDYIIKADLYIRERYYVKNYPCINAYNPHRTAEDLRVINTAKGRKYRSNPDNLRKIKEWEQTVIDCECGRSYTQACAARHKTSETHKYFVEHGEVKGRKKEKVVCECGGYYEPHGRLRHERSKKHQRFIDGN